MKKEPIRYKLTGTVREFDENGRIVKEVKGEQTKAVSPKQAKSHIVSRAKTELGKMQNTKYVFVGTCEEI